MIDDVERAWKLLTATGRHLMPVVYVNSRADLKAFCGKNGGFVCTSANAKEAMEYVLSRGAVPFFFPDENLGRNTAHAMGISDDEIFLWDPFEDMTDTVLRVLPEKGDTLERLLLRARCLLPSDIEEPERPTQYQRHRPSRMYPALSGFPTTRVPQAT